MVFIHDTELRVHGNLKSSNCVVNSRWTLQVTDYGLHGHRTHGKEDPENEHARYRSQSAVFTLRKNMIFITNT